ncbi:Fe(3+)-siderophore ABC transporter permease [Nocardiopsis gilva YIM 90087]|uniref:Fe(3+)-siderophore ABC transporter permease n=2 Tax=Nocardiopsis gilva TaxID=280236 RepID=A0A223S2N3_9ACTN|nr:Fe(3+)-siderophore ABC transporter permease [Nocardiopsis gilva YIM 90087]
MSLDRHSTAVAGDSGHADDSSVAASALDLRTRVHGRTHAMRALGLLLALAVLALCVMLSIAVGAKSIPLPTVWGALWGSEGSYEHSVIYELRVPRAVLGVFVGAALGLAGALMQALTRNPLAEPGILGVNQGAAAAVVIAIIGLGMTSPDEYVWFAFAGAGITALLVYALGSRGRSGATPVRLALAGTAVAALLQGLIYSVIALDSFTFDRIRFWQVGALAGRDLDVFVKVWPFLVVGLITALLLAPALNAVALGDDLAAALGARISVIRALSALSIMLLCGAATATAGPIWFVGLIVPHVARAIVGPDQRWVLPYSAVFAAILLTCADTLGRVVLPSGELEVGIVTAFIGAPVFIALVRARRMAQV